MSATNTIHDLPPFGVIRSGPDDVAATVFILLADPPRVSANECDLHPGHHQHPSTIASHTHCAALTPQCVHLSTQTQGTFLMMR